MTRRAASNRELTVGLNYGRIPVDGFPPSGCGRPHCGKENGTFRMKAALLAWLLVHLTSERASAVKLPTAKGHVSKAVFYVA